MNEHQLALIADKPARPRSTEPKLTADRRSPTINAEPLASCGLDPRRRAMRHGPECLADGELLEALLACRTADSGPAVAGLLRRFGSPWAALTASLESLQQADGVDADMALDLVLLRTVAQRFARSEIPQRTVVSSWTALLAYVRIALQHESREQFRVLFLDARNQLITDEVMGRGSVDHAPVYPREVMRRALELSAASLILVHNHPSGDPTPSRADIDMTRQVADAGRLLRIAVHDHLVVGRGSVASFKSLGLL